MTSPSSLAAVFADHMVLQRDEPLVFWGWGMPGATVGLDFLEPGGALRFSLSARVEADGRFRLLAPPQPAGGPHELVFHGAERLTLSDVWVGEVWLASGQSNMEWTVAQSAFAEEELATARDPRLRCLYVERRATEAARCEWRRVDADSAARMTAVGFTFGRILCDKLGVAVGIVDASWGGTLLEAWASASALERVMSLQAELDAWQRELQGVAETKRRYADALGEWERRYLVQDRGNEGEARGFHEVEPAWTEPTLDVPTLWQRHGLSFNGAVWFRRELELPSDWSEPSTLHLGRIDDFDHTYVNGQLIGAHPQGTPMSCDVARSYAVPSGVLRPGRNVLTVRVFDHVGEGGFLDPPSRLFLESGDGARLALAGPWQYRVERAEPLVPGEVWAHYPQTPRILRPQDRPCALFEAMLAPLLPFAMRGVIWYQGESNVTEHASYAARFRALIQDWQARLGASERVVTFLFVQLASFRASRDWAYLREAQAQALALPGTGMVVTLDIGAPNDIHPRNKREVGRRLASLALRDVYGTHAEPIRGPVPSVVRVVNGEARVEYEAQAPLATTHGGTAVNGFELELSDGTFVPVAAHLERPHIVVPLPSGISPLRLCYGFDDAPDVNLVNEAGLPAEPFRWPLFD